MIALKQGPAVFVARSGGFEAVPVQLLSRGPQDATVRGRLGPNDQVAVAGVTELKAASAQN